MTVPVASQLRRHGRAGPSRGVSLLEMLVALTILAVASTTLFGWVFQISGQIQRLNNQQTQALAQLRALRYLTLLNPAQTPQGQQQFTDFVLSWNAAAITPPLQALSPGGAILPTRISIYEVKATLTRDDRAGAWVAFDTRLLGWTAAAVGAGADSAGDVPGIAGGRSP